MQEGPQSQGQWCWYTGTPLCPAVASSCGIWPVEGFLPVPSRSCDWGIGSRSARPHWGTLDSPRGWLGASLGK